MKYNYLLFVLFLLNVGFSQDLIEEALEYYPLHTGNYWQYEYVTSGTGPDLKTIHVVGDTLLNGKIYKILEKIYLNYYEYSYERIDSSTANVYKYEATAPKGEFLLDSLASQLNDTSFAQRKGWTQFYNYTTCSSVFTDTILDYITTIKEFQNSLFANLRYRHAKNIGQIWEYQKMIITENTSIIYANIQGAEYGEKVVIVERDEYFQPELMTSIKTTPIPSIR